MKKSVITILISLSLTSIEFAESYPGWTPLITGVNEDLHSIYFFNHDTGWAAGPRTLIKTVDGGLSWTSITVDTTSGISDMFFISPDTGWALTNVPYYTRGTIIGTTDGGIHWDTLWSEPEYRLLTLFFINSQIGWVGSEWSIPFTSEGRIFKTIDGGMNWSNIYNYGHEIRSLYFLDSENGHCLSHISDMLFGIEIGDIHKTVDGGNTWNLWNSFLTGKYWLSKINFINPDTGWVIGFGENPEGFYVLKTVDSGTNWNIIHLDSSTFYTDIYFVQNNLGWMSGYYGEIRKSNDGGYTWAVQESGTTNKLYSIFFITPDTGWIAGERGLVLKTTSSGLTEIKSSNKYPINIFDDLILYQNFPNPFNSNTNISFYLKNAGIVELKLYDVMGELVKVLMNEYKDQGLQSINYDLNFISTGIYFYCLESSGLKIQRKMFLIR